MRPSIRYLLLLLLLGGCAQDRLAGFVKVKYGVDSAGRPTATYESGKEFSTVTAIYTRSKAGDISITVTANDVRAFEAFKIRAAVHKEALNVVGEMLPKAIEVGLCAAGIVTACAKPLLQR